MLVLSGSHPSFGELAERHREHLDVDRGQDQPENLPALGPHEAINVGPLVASLESSDGSLSRRCPHPPYHRLEAQPSLVLRPELYPLGFRMRLPDFLQSLGETFLKASRSEASADRALEGLGTCGV